MDMRSRIVDLISESGVGFKEKLKTIYTTCPVCQQADKFSILKSNGSCVCYRGSCTFGKRPFVEWVALTFHLDEKEAAAKVYGHQREYKPDLRSSWSLKKARVDEDATKTDLLLAGLTDMKWPEFHMVPLADPAAAEGVAYLQGRGITMETAEKYDIAYSKTYRRVYFPVKMSGRVYGYQGRHIDKVEDGLRVRNNEGFQRETLVMFADNLLDSKFAIVAEGPVDAIKFDLVGANICTMGKVVTEKQLDIIRSYGIDELYLALDDDALHETMVLATTAKLKAYRLVVPQSCKERCAAIGKKADFGECSFEEAQQAFENAISMDKTNRALQPAK